MHEHPTRTHSFEWSFCFSWWRQETEKIDPDFPRFLPLLWDIISPTGPGSSLGSPSSGTCLIQPQLARIWEGQPRLLCPTDFRYSWGIPRNSQSICDITDTWPPDHQSDLGPLHQALDLPRDLPPVSQPVGSLKRPKLLTFRSFCWHVFPKWLTTFRTVTRCLTRWATAALNHLTWLLLIQKSSSSTPRFSRLLNWENQSRYTFQLLLGIPRCSQANCWNLISPAGPGSGWSPSFTGSWIRETRFCLIFHGNYQREKIRLLDDIHNKAEFHKKQLLFHFKK